MSDTPTYTEAEIPSYKFRRLPATFWHLWKREKEAATKSINQLRYGLVTHMVMQRFKDEEIIRMMYGWQKIYGLTITHTALVAIIKSVKDYTLEERRRLKRKEVQKYRAKQKAMKLEAALTTEAEFLVAA